MEQYMSLLLSFLILYDENINQNMEINFKCFEINPNDR